MNATLSQIADYLWNQSWQVAALVVAVGLVSHLLRNRSAHVRYLLWLLVPAKCLVPPVLGIALPILPQAVPPASPSLPDYAYYGAVESTVLEASPADMAQPVSVPQDRANTAQAFVSELSVREVLVIVWLAGAGLFAVAAAVKAGRMTRWLARERQVPPEGFVESLRELFPSTAVRRMPTIWLIEGVGQPFVWGLFRGDIYLPAASAFQGGGRHQRDILAHELGHILRCDAAVNLLQVLSQMLFWFHPFVWWANQRIRAEREKSCDEMAIARLDARPRDYSRAIVETLLNEHKSFRRIPSLAVAGPVKNIEERIKTMLHPGRKFYRSPSLFATTLVLLLALFVVPTTLALTRRQAIAPGTSTEATPAETTIEQIEVRRLSSADNLKRIGLALNLYADEHDNKYPDELMSLVPDYIAREQAEQVSSFIAADVEYLGAGKTHPPDPGGAELPLAFDLTLLRAAKGTNVLFADGHVEFVGGAQLEKYGVRLAPSHLEVLGVWFEPIHEGKNTVGMQVRNTSDKEQVFGVHIYTRSPDYANGGIGWDAPFFETVKPEETRFVRFVFKIYGPVTENTYVHLRFYNPPTRAEYEYKQYFEQRHCTGRDLQKAGDETDRRKPASPAETRIAMQGLREIQELIRQRQYEQVWQHFTRDYQRAEYQTGFERFLRAMEPTHPMDSAFTWEREDFLRLAPREVFKRDGALSLTAAMNEQTWTIDLVREDRLWKIDWVAGYRPGILGPQTPPQAGGNAATTNLKVLGIRFDPIQPGRNTVSLQIQNTSQTDQVFGLDVRTESSVRNWQRQFTKSVQAGRTETMRFEFEITGPLRNASLIRLRFYNPASAAALDLDNWFELHRYTGEKLDQHEVTYGEPKTAEQAATTKAPSRLKVLDVRFEPIRQGKNVVRIEVQNLAGDGQVFGVSVQARSPEVGGWGTTFLDTIEPGQTQWTRYGFELRGSRLDDASIALSFFSPGRAAGFDSKKWFDSKPWSQWFHQERYSGRDLPQRQAPSAPLPSAPRDQVSAAIETLRTIQDHLKQKEYDDAWKLLTKGCRDAGFFRRLEVFKGAMEKIGTPDRFSWLREESLELKPESAVLQDGVLILPLARGQKNWTVDFVQEDGRWKVDWSDGYVTEEERTARWEDAVLPKMEKRSTRHFDIYYLKDSTAGREIEQIAQAKDAGFEEVCQFLGKDSDLRIRLVLFENGDIKQRATGHQGAGWAYGNTIVEVYNEKERLDPYHETTHILMGPFGQPPALFNEGFATCMSERLGAHALESLSGGQASIYARAHELKGGGEWIPLTELLGYTEIGSARSRPPVAYPEAASFVEFLIDTYGKDKFLQAYKTLQNSDQKDVQEQNVRKLAEIYGASLESLETQWQEAISKPAGN